MQPVSRGGVDAESARNNQARLRGPAYNHWRICYPPPALQSLNATREIAMAKGQMRSNKEKKKPKADKNIKKGGATPSPFSSGKTPAGQSPHMNKK